MKQTHPSEPSRGCIVSAIREFLQLEAAGGILLMLATVVAMVAANTAAEGLYQAFLDTRVAVQLGALHIAKPLILWINDGLMAVFFFLVGLEIKREVMEGELTNPAQITLPALGAVGGMVGPAAIYAWLNWNDAVAIDGWAIPAATDIAFALGVLSLLGSRVPNGLKIFLLTLAILDDLGAILIIAIFYTDQLSVASLAVAAAAVVGLWILNWRGVKAIPPYFFVGLVLWVAVLKSGVHATLAGVVLALFIPLKADADGPGPLRRLEHDLHPVVAYAILPLFAFANAGVSLKGLSVGSLLEPVPLGIAAGLLIGKMVGVFGMSAIAVKSGLARLPEGASWKAMLGVSTLCGIGFTMSIFITGLAFGDAAPQQAIASIIGILAGTLACAVVGYLILAAALPKSAVVDQRG